MVKVSGLVADFQILPAYRLIAKISKIILPSYPLSLISTAFLESRIYPFRPPLRLFWPLVQLSGIHYHPLHFASRPPLFSLDNYVTAIFQGDFRTGLLEYLSACLLQNALSCQPGSGITTPV